MSAPNDFKPTPRITSSYRQSFRGKEVKMIGKLVTLTSSTEALFQDSNGEFYATLPSVSRIF